MVLLLDNYDSFTYNLAHRLGELGAEVQVVRNDRLSVDDIVDRRPTHLVISPGPGRPETAGISVAALQRFAGTLPILGVCLGHQTIGDVHGMTVTRHVVPMHGKTSPIHHTGSGVFRGLSNPFEATRYHSLVVLAETIPKSEPGRDGWEVTAWTDEVDAATGATRRVVMGLRRLWADAAKKPLEGVQFHPESFLTLEGPKLLKNFLEM